MASTSAATKRRRDRAERCYYCSCILTHNIPARLGTDATIEHLNSRTAYPDGRPNLNGTIVIACKNCNEGRAQQEPGTRRTLAEGVRRARSSQPHLAQHLGHMPPAHPRRTRGDLGVGGVGMSELAALVGLLDEIDCHSFTLHATDRAFHASKMPDADEAARISLRLSIVGRSAFEQVCTLLAAKVTERVVNPGQRSWWAESDTNTRKLLIEGVSFQHHDDWEPRAVA